MRRSSARGVILITLIFGLAVTPASGTLEHSTSVASPGETDVRWQVETPANESTVSPPQQEDPALVQEEGDTQAVERWLNARMRQRLNESALQISQGQYEAAQGELGGDYEDLLSKYVEVSGETDSELDDQRGEQFNETAQTQSEYARTAAEYNRVYEHYQTARENGNETRARRLARELHRLSTELDQLSAESNQNYRNLSNSTGESFTTEIQAITNTTNTIRQQTETVIETTFTQTTITAQADQKGSFSDPILITGQVSTNDSTPPSFNGTVTIHIHDRTFQSSVTPNGTFVVRYAPTTAPTGNLTGELTFVPAPTSAYLGSETTVQTFVVPVTPSLTINSQPSTVHYGDPIGPTGQVTVSGRTVSDMPVTLVRDGEPVARTRTNASGGYAFTAQLTADVPPGKYAHTVRVGESGTALLPTNQTTSLTVEETPTRMTLTATPSSDGVTVSGHLHTDEGVDIGSQTIVLTRNGSTLQSVETNEAGQFETTIPRTQIGQENTSVELVAEFDGAGTNLASTRANTVVRFESEQSGLPILPLVVGGGAVGLLGLGYGLYRRRQLDVEPGSRPTDTNTPQVFRTEQKPRWDDRLTTAQEALERGDLDHAVRTLYGTVRSEYTPTGNTAQTHWEFYTAVADTLDTSRRETLRRVTELYEAVQFADHTPESEQVATLLAEIDDQYGTETPDPDQPAASRTGDD